MYKFMVLAAICVGAVSTKPEQRVAQPNAAVSAKVQESENQKRQDAQNAATQALVNKQLQIQQQIADVIKRENEQSQQNVDIQREVAKYTRYLTIVGAIQGAVLFFTLLAIKRQANIMQNQLIVSNRARLAIGAPQRPVGNEIRLPIENYGQFSAKITFIDVEIKIIGGKSDHKGLRKSEYVNKLVASGKGSEVGLSLKIPSSLDIFGSGVQLSVTTTIKYEIGIEGEDTQTFYWFYFADHVRWVSGTSIVGMSFKEADITEIKDEKEESKPDI